ncbi:hypothetical protein, conserved, partial [Eimeria maxima]
MSRVSRSEVHHFSPVPNSSDPSSNSETPCTVLPIASTVRQTSPEVKVDMETGEDAAVSQASHVSSGSETNGLHATNDPTQYQGLNRDSTQQSSDHASPATTLNMPRLNFFWLKKEPPRTTCLPHDRDFSSESSEDFGFRQEGNALHGTPVDERCREVINDLTQTQSGDIEGTRIAISNRTSSPSLSESPNDSAQASEGNSLSIAARLQQDPLVLPSLSSDKELQSDAELSPLSQALHFLQSSHAQHTSSQPNVPPPYSKAQLPRIPKPTTVARLDVRVHPEDPAQAYKQSSSPTPTPPIEQTTAADKRASSATLPIMACEAVQSETGDTSKLKALEGVSKAKTAGPPPARPPPKATAPQTSDTAS